jgi:hypothetical protein
VNGGLQDVYYASSTNGGRTFSPNLRVNDRSIERDVGIWENNIGSNHNVGVASGPNGVYFAWQEPRNRDLLAQPEDVYMAKLNLNGPDPVAAGNDHPRFEWAITGAGIAGALFGVILFILSRASRSREVAVSSRTA